MIRSTRRLIEVHGLDSGRIGSTAAAGGIVAHELTPQPALLEGAFMELTRWALVGRKYLQIMCVG